MSPGGRRPGNADTRAEIIAAARLVFADQGYEKASLRAVARAAGVDAALVHHYFDGKSDLFVAAMALPFDPRTVKNEYHGEEPMPYLGEATVEGFLTMWDLAEGTGSSFASCVAAMREFVNERVWSVTRGADEDDQTFWHRRALMSSALMGLAFTRYILRVPPISTATPKEIAAWAGPTLTRFRTEAAPEETD